MMEEKFMNLAIEESNKGDFPFGAVIVKNNEIISKGHNSMETDKDATAHAEIKAIRGACTKLNSVKLQNCILYVNKKPCEMCYAAAKRAGIQKIIYKEESKDEFENSDLKCVKLSD